MITRDSVIKGDVATGRLYIDDVWLSPSRSQSIRNHSPVGYAWGYGGSGPSQLALAIMLEATPDRETALKLYQQFKWDVIAPLNKDADFRISGSTVIDWLAKQDIVKASTSA